MKFHLVVLPDQKDCKDRKTDREDKTKERRRLLQGRLAMQTPISVPI